MILTIVESFKFLQVVIQLRPVIFSVPLDEVHALELEFFLEEQAEGLLAGGQVAGDSHNHFIFQILLISTWISYLSQ